MIAGLLLAVGCALATSVSVLLKQRARGTLFRSEYPRQPEVREGAVAAELAFGVGERRPFAFGGRQP